MSISPSQCGRSCSESGWTLYLDESSSSGEKWKGARGGNEERYKSKGHPTEEDDEENLSMISDASSGPPYCELEDCSSSGKTKKKAGEPGRKEQNSYEDTATSFRMSFTKKEQGSLSKQASKAKDYSSPHGKSYSKSMQKDGLHFRK